MGLFDRVHIWAECPYCGKTQNFVAQTKDLDRAMAEYTAIKREVRESEDDFAESRIENYNCYIPEQYQGKIKGIRATFSCNSVQCQFDADRDWILVQGTPSGFGRSFEATIEVEEDGMIIRELTDIKLDDNDREELKKYKEEYPEIYEYLKDKYEHEPIITRNWTEGEKAVESDE